MFDILVVGGGPAGLTAALYALRGGKSVLVLEGDAFGGQISASPLVENWPGTARISGVEFADQLMGQALELGMEAEPERVTEVRRTEEGFSLTAGGQEFQGASLILATGARHRKLGLDGEEDWAGRGISYCAVCDGAFFQGQDVAVVGGGDSALQSALYLSSLCRRVYLIHRRSQYRAEAGHIRALQSRKNILPLLGRTVTGFQGGEVLTGVELTEAETGHTEDLSVAGLFAAVGQVPDNGLYTHLVELDEAGYIRAGEDCITSCPGVFAAGDCRTKPLRQLTTAAADGSVAALAVCQWLDSRL